MSNEDLETRHASALEDIAMGALRGMRDAGLAPVDMCTVSVKMATAAHALSGSSREEFLRVAAACWDSLAEHMDNCQKCTENLRNGKPMGRSH